MRAAAAAAGVLLLNGCATSIQLPAAPGARFDPIAFFTGRSHGEGTLDTVSGSPVRVAVDSVGTRQGAMLVLDQTIRRGTKPPSVRRWTMRLVAPGRYTGTLTDAAGPVTGNVDGPRATIRYTMKNGMQVEQQLALQNDGRTLLNHLQVRRFGLRLATLTETIRKLD
ncbi:MAG: hypothetical protein AVDCRST_MAG44-1017 [uncultured Sphingomonas sp.]|uniref:DUF3833 domain-containing protein n=1 Tax=uncultured Sphingomonas sp. TaxID=158754 RepID=A0A6J4ST43_9SPHN|nr:MAG: hypothetical protein AVDCRST_MAG44-1017 [uncultured Sphingomonas sp.]